MVHVSDEQLEAIVGNFHQPDVGIFRTLLEESARTLGGDLAELGVFFGRSAVLVGASLQAGETLTVVDLFEAEAGDEANKVENDESYDGLTRRRFEDNYAAVLGSLPTVVQGLSTSIAEHAAHGTHRFVHVDASHLYDHVAADIEVARLLLKPDGIVVLDDIRQEHTPGVAAAAWQSVVQTGLKPFAITPYKLYATWGDPGLWQPAVERWSVGGRWTVEHQSVNGHDLLRLGSPPRQKLPPEHPARRFVPPVLWPTVRRLGMRRSA